MFVLSSTFTPSRLLIRNRECTSGEKKAIQQAYDDYKKLTNQKGVVSGIDWNSAAALELLGPAGMKQYFAYPPAGD